MEKKNRNILFLPPMLISHFHDKGKVGWAAALPGMYKLEDPGAAIHIVDQLLQRKHKD